MATSGTVSAVSFNQRQVIDHAFRRAGVAPERVGNEQIQIAQELLFTLTSEWINAGIPLWTITKTLLGLTVGSPEVPCPQGTVDVMQSYWRTLMPYRGSASLSTGADGSALFGGQPNTDVVIAGPNPAVTVNFGSPTEVDTIGVLLGGVAPVTAAFEIQTSVDGITYAITQTLPSATYTPDSWTLFDLDPTITAQYVRIVYASSNSLTLNQLNFGLANGEDIRMGDLNIDDYFNLPNKYFKSNRSTSAWVDRQIAGPIIKLWPVPNIPAFYNACVYAVLRRHIMDPGSMSQNPEIPQRWNEALIWRLAVKLLDEMPMEMGQNANYMALMAKQQTYQRVEQSAAKAEMLAWSEERRQGPIRLAPDISGYTR